MATSRLALPQPTGTDLISQGDDNITALAGILDNAAMYAQGTFASRPAASALNGKFYLATDISILYLSNGTTWFEVSRGGAEVPIGGSVEYGGSADPADTRWILEDGRAISRTTYAAAFAILGTAYGAGDGSTTFNIPDSRGRVSVGPDNMGTGAGGAGRMASNNTRGAVGGAELTTLAAGNIPSHLHAVGTLVNDTVPAHDHTVGTLDAAPEAAHTHGVGTYSAASEAAHTHGATGLSMGTESADHTHSGVSGTENQNHTHNMGSVLTDSGLRNSGASASFIVPQISTVGSTAELQTHTHSFTTGGRSAGHTHGMTGATAAGTGHTHSLSGSSAAGASHDHALSGNVGTNGAHLHTISGSTALTGSGTPFNTTQPYVVKNKIIRVL